MRETPSQMQPFPHSTSANGIIHSSFIEFKFILNVWTHRNFASREVFLFVCLFLQQVAQSFSLRTDNRDLQRQSER